MGALVTGGASGLGRATAELLASKGAKVVILDLPTSNGEAVAAEIGGDTQFVGADVTNEDQVNAAITAASEKAPLRAVVNCAGRGHTLGDYRLPFARLLASGV
ncbi:SDR family NAD(P)-dependent oxidoreductase [Sphingobium cloacae]|uniref:SDR family NAD(P)-dependent oxidoreductase n=1 Tax=Sphingobium cloacae TaxID=120107 RepID=UPI001E36739E|nr:SDR family NAD(P)-dependent oxidoreductase [Sphingobium cloacae]